MDEPTRLLDDPAAPPGLREDLRAASEIAPQSYDAERGLTRLRTALVAGTAGAAAASSASAAAGAKAGLTWAALAVAVTAGMGGALYLAVDGPAPNPASEEPARVPATSSGEASEALPAEPGVPASPVAPAEPSPALEEPVSEAPSRATTEAPPRRTPQAPSRAAEAPALEPTPDDPDERLRAEIGQLARIRSQLESAPANALALARDGQRRFAGGMFGEERAALVVFALDRLGRRAEAEREARRFIAAHPVGPFTSRVRAILERD